MGCTQAREGNGDHFPRTFKVYNVDDQGQERNAGKIEITATELVLFQKGKAPFRWPLRSLRRYGFDAELFSFESGRCCPTGPDIYAFKCKHAEALFNLLQECIQRAGQEEQQHTTNGLTDVGSWLGDSRHAFEFRQVTPALSDLPHAANPLHVYVNSTLLVGNGRDVAGTGQKCIPPGGGGHEYVNTAHALLKDPASHTSLAAMMTDTDSVVLINRTECKAAVTSTTGEHTIQYAELDFPNTKLDIDNGGTAVSNGLAHVNNHCHRHSCVDEIEPASSLYGASNGHRLGPTSPGSSSTSNQDSPLRLGVTSSTARVSYAMIDFFKTAALNTKTAYNDEGSRKTRHDCNIDELYSE